MAQRLHGSLPSRTRQFPLHADVPRVPLSKTSHSQQHEESHQLVGILVNNNPSCSQLCQQGTSSESSSDITPVRGCLEAVLGRPGRAARQAVQVPKGLQVQVKASLVALKGRGWLGSAAKGALLRSRVS